MLSDWRRLLILAGTVFQVPVIKYAKGNGITVITCDNRPANPGHTLADEYANVSTTDAGAVLRVVKELCVDGILAYASDPAAPTAAYVAEQLGLPGNPVEAVTNLGVKSRYRALLKNNDFNYPAFQVLSGDNALNPLVSEMPFPVVIKPTDSSGSRGVNVVTHPDGLENAVQEARTFGRNGEVVIEEVVNRVGPQIGGEAYVHEGRLVMMCLGDQRVNERAFFSRVPLGMTFPTRLSQNEQDNIRSELQRLITAAGFKTGALNLEIMKDGDGRFYLMEVAPRSGGNLLPELMRYTCGFEVARYSVDHALGIPSVPPDAFGTTGDHYAYFAVHAKEPGIFHGFRKSEWVAERIIEEHLILRPGDPYQRFDHSGCAIGIWLMRFESQIEADAFFENPYRHYELLKVGDPVVA